MKINKKLMVEGRKVLDPLFSPLLDCLAEKGVTLVSSLMFLKYVLSVVFGEAISELEQNPHLDPKFVQDGRLTLLGSWTVKQVRVAIQKLDPVFDRNKLSGMMRLWVTRKLVGIALGEGVSNGKSHPGGKGAGVDPVVQKEGDSTRLPAKVLPLRKERTKKR